MNAVRLHRFGGPEVLVLERLAMPTPASGEALVRVMAAGVGPWDAWIRTGRSVKVTEHDLPITPGADIAGIVEAVGPGVTTLQPGDRVFGVANGSFTGGYASHAVADVARLAPMPSSVGFEEAASLPVIATTALQMLSLLEETDRARPAVVLGASGNVGGVLVQLARQIGLRIIALGAVDEADRLRAQGAAAVVEEDTLEAACAEAGVLLDTIGGVLAERAMRALGKGGLVVSIVGPQDAVAAGRPDLRSAFFIVDVDARGLGNVVAAIDAGVLEARVGAVLPLAEARRAHDMVDNRVGHARGKIILVPEHRERILTRN